MWLRFDDAQDQLVPLPEEAAQQQGLQQGAQRPLLRLLSFWLSSLGSPGKSASNERGAIRGTG